MSDTGSPLNLPLLPFGFEDWDDEMRDAFTAINNAVATINTTLAAKADLVGGEVPSDQLPAIAINDTVVADSEAEMLALTGLTVGAVALRTDTDPPSFWVLTALPESSLANWLDLDLGIGVTSINGEQGVVTGFAKLAANSQTFTGTDPEFAEPLTVADATDDGHAVNKGQLDAAIEEIETAGGTFARHSALYGNGSATDITVTHSLGYRWVSVIVVDASTNKVIVPGEIEYTSTTQLVLRFGDAPANNGIRVTVGPG